jgi:hypothetical protein
MKNWFTVKLKFTKQMEDGRLKRVTDSFLFDASNFTDAETIAFDEVAKEIKGEVIVTAISKTPFVDVLENGIYEKFYKVKVVFVAYDADSEREKRTASLLLVESNSAQNAIIQTNDHLKDSVSSFEIIGVNLSPIVGIVVPNQD